MMGRNHVVANVGTMGVVMAAGAVLSGYSGKGCQYIQDGLNVIKQGFLAGYDSIGKVPGIALIIGLFIFGTLLPDIDSPNSILGRHVKVPGPHRTWTHTFWALAAISLFRILHVSFAWMALGYFLHLFYDSFSRAGVCWFWPIEKYRRYGNGAMVKRGHKLKIYRAGQPSEYVCAAVIATLGALCWAYLIYIYLRPLVLSFGF